MQENEIREIAKRITQLWIQSNHRLRKHRPQLSHEQQRHQGEMTNRLRHECQHVRRYEDWDLQEKARSIVPVDRLHEEARKEVQECTDSKESFEDILLRRLVRWFKNEFFQWVNEPPCEKCQSGTKSMGATSASHVERQFGAGVCELYKCQACFHVNRFPRYNDPGKLLETRRGRCGEWANTFTLICRSMGFDARHVIDWTDHVWTEVFSEHKNRWLHVDPCEAAVDTPLVYEAGWGKKLSYIVACSADEIRDVTRRYTQKYPDVLLRRTTVSEAFLQQIMKDQPVAKQNMIIERWQREDQQMKANRQVSANELIGRQSGSLEWRSTRGETGNTKLEPTAKQLPDVKYPLFSSSKNSVTDHFLFLGSAKSSQNILNLTANQQNECGAVWSKDRLPINASFAIEFSFVMKKGGADGMALVFQTHSDSAIGEGGSGLGYHGMPSSVAIEIDTYQSIVDYNDPNGNHISIQTRGSGPNSAHHQYSIGANSCILPPLSNGNEYFVLVTFDASKKHLCVLLSDQGDSKNSGIRGKNYMQVVEIDNFTFAQYLAGKNNDHFWWGFTAATGGISQEHTVRYCSAWKL